MFIPHHPLPMRAVRYFLLLSALSMAGAAKVRPEAMELLRKVRRFIDMTISPFSSFVGTGLCAGPRATFAFTLTAHCLKSSEKSRLHSRRGFAKSVGIGHSIRVLYD